MVSSTTTRALAGAAVAALAVARVTRFFTSDTLGEWTIVGPAKRWAWGKETPYDPDQFDESDPVPTPQPTNGWRSKLVSAFDCPWCIGFHVGVLVLLGNIIAPKIPVVRHVWKFLINALALNAGANALADKLGTYE